MSRFFSYFKKALGSVTRQSEQRGGANSRFRSPASLKARGLRCEPLEERRLLAIVYADPTLDIVDTDSIPGINYGDAATFTPTSDPADNVSGLIYGIDAFDSIADAMAVVSHGGTINIAGGETLEDSLTGVTVDVSEGGYNDVLFVSITGADTNGAVNINPPVPETISYVPGPDFFSSSKFSYLIGTFPTDTVTGNVWVDVLSVNDAPSFTLGANQSVAEDTGPHTVTGFATNILPGPVSAPSPYDESGQTVSFNVLNDNSGLFSVAPAISNAGDLTFALAADAFGTANVTVTAVDDGGTADGGVDASAPVTFSIEVAPVNDPPVAVVENYSTNEDVAVGGNVLTNDTDVDGGPLVATVVPGSEPANGVLFLNTNGSFTYTPDPNWSGIDQFTYKVDDQAGGSDTSTVTITVAAINDAPVADDATETVAEDGTLTSAVTGSDVESEPITFAIATGPSNGTITAFNSSTGAYTYEPNLNFNGSDSFTFTANDGSVTGAPGTVAITVTAVDDAPIAGEDEYDAVEDTTLVIPASLGLLQNDIENDGQSLAAVFVTNPSNGTLTLVGDGGFTYVPDANFNGMDTFTYASSAEFMDRFWLGQGTERVI